MRAPHTGRGSHRWSRVRQLIPLSSPGPSTGCSALKTCLASPTHCVPPLRGPGDPPELMPGLPRQQYATRHARTEGAVSGQAAVTALQGGGATPARQVRLGPTSRGGGLQAPPCTGSWRVERGLSVAPPLPDTTFPQMWMNAVLEGAAVPSTVSTPQAVTGVTVRRGTAHLWTGHSACPGEGPPGWPQTPQQVNSLLVCTPSAEPGGMGREVGWQMRWGLPYLGSSPENWGVEVCRRDRGEGLSSA